MCKIFDDISVVSGVKSCLQFRSTNGSFKVVYNTITIYGALKLCTLRLRVSNIWLLCLLQIIFMRICRRPFPNGVRYVLRDVFNHNDAENMRHENAYGSIQ